jgi:hypothetical protein
MKTSTLETEKSPREIARLFLEKWEIYASPLDAVELLIKARDERAALIAESAFDPAHTYASENSSAYRTFDAGQRHVIEKIASAIRGK